MDIEQLIKNLVLDQPLLLDDLAAWMDGGSVTLKINNSKGQPFSVEFV